MKTQVWRLLPGILLLVGLLTMLGLRSAPPVGAATSFTLAPTNLTFGNQTATTTSAAQPVTLTNTGDTPLEILTITFVVGGDAFGQTNNCPVSPATLAIEASCTINVTFTPPSSAGFSGRMRVTPSGTIPQDVTMTGTGVGPAFSLSTTHLNFVGQLVTTTSAPSAVTLTNDSTIGLTITSYEFVVGGDVFAQTNDCPVSPATLAPGASCDINVTFTPAEVAGYGGRMRVNTHFNLGQDVTMSGNGTHPPITLSPAHLTFDDQPVTTTSAPQPVTLTNDSAVGLPIASIAFIVGGDSFAQTNDCPATLAAGASCDINVTFTPPTVGGFGARLRLTTQYGDSRDTTMSGTGTPPPFGLSPASHDFGNVTVGTTSASQPFTLTNNDTSTLIIQSIQFTGGSFTQSNDCSGGIAPAATCTINVAFVPTVAGASSGKLRATSTTGVVRESDLAGTGVTSQPTFTVTLTTSGDCAVTLTPTGPYAADAVVTAQANFDATTTVLAGWTLDGTFIGWPNPFDFSIAGANHALVATCAARPTFGDLQQNDPAREAIIQLAARGYIRGYQNGNYGSGDGVQRAQMAALIARATPFGPGIPTNGTLTPPACVAGSWDCEDWGTAFTDQGGIDASLWRNAGTLFHYDVARGYTAQDCAARGRAFPCYGPTDPVSYAQTIAFITRAMIAKGYWEAQPNAPLPYSGVPAVLATEVRTFHFYTGGVPALAAGQDWNDGASRGWFARALWAALDSYWSIDRVP